RHPKRDTAQGSRGSGRAPPRVGSLPQRTMVETPTATPPEAVAMTGGTAPRRRGAFTPDEMILRRVLPIRARRCGGASLFDGVQFLVSVRRYEPTMPSDGQMMAPTHRNNRARRA